MKTRLIMPTISRREARSLQAASLLEHTRMRSVFRPSQTLAAVALVAIMLAGCETSTVQPQRPTPDRQLEQAETLARNGDHRGAAQAYETLALQSQRELRDRY